MRSVLLVGVVLAAAWAGAAGAADPDPRRVALVVGNSGYEYAGALGNPVNDAHAVAEALESVGFGEVILATDVGKFEFEKALQRFDEALLGAEIGVFFYAGHGLQVNGTNYLVPTDAQLAEERHLRFQAIRADFVLDLMSWAPTKLNVVVLDACRDNPFLDRIATSARTATRAVTTGRGLAPIDAPAGGSQSTLIAFSTSPGMVAADGGEATAPHSPYTWALLRALGEPGLPVEAVFKRTREAVFQVTGGAQLPWESAAVIGDFYLHPPAPPAEAVAAASAEGGGTGVQPSDQTEFVFWGSIASSPYPDDFEAYLARYPSGAFADLARNRIERLRAAEGTAPDPRAVPQLPTSVAEGFLSDGERRAAQRALGLFGYYRGRAGGAFDFRTRAAIEQFQAAEGYEVTGFLTAAQAERLLRSAADLEGLVAAPDVSPLGRPAAEVPGSEDRYRQGLAHEAQGADPRQIEEAVYWYRLAAAGGHARALSKLGLFHARGLGVAGDAGAAALLWRAAAGRGEPVASYNLGAMLQYGIGVAPDEAAAVRWYERAAAAGHPQAREALEVAAKGD